MGLKNVIFPLLRPTRQVAYIIYVILDLLFVDACFEGHFIVHLYISRHKAKLFFDLSHDFEIWCAVESISALMEKFEQMVSHVPACNLQSFETGFNDIATKDRNTVSNTITTV